MYRPLRSLLAAALLIAAVGCSFFDDEGDPIVHPKPSPTSTGMNGIIK